MSKLRYPLINSITLVATLVINYLSNTGSLGEASVGEISALHPTLITPASYAFGIWGFIYLWLLAFVAYQWYVWAKKSYTEILSKTGWWFSIANIANAAWVLVWTNDYIGWSVVIMFVLLASLIALVLRLDMELGDPPVRILALVWWPICWYLGWIILASVTNVAAYLVSTGWSGGALGGQSWTMIMLGIATLIYLFLIYSRNMREASLPGIWGFVAIAVKHWETNSALVLTALAGAFVLLLASGYHGYKNKETAPAAKWKRGEI